MRKMKLKEAIEILQVSEDKQLQAIAKLLDDARGKMNALFEFASGEYHGNEGNEENEIDDILAEAAEVLERPYTRLTEEDSSSDDNEGGNYDYYLQGY